jgi:putative NADH-flavin reductase
MGEEGTWTDYTETARNLHLNLLCPDSSKKHEKLQQEKLLSWTYSPTLLIQPSSKTD